MRPLLDCKVILEVKCEECDGEGAFRNQYKYLNDAEKCSECDGYGAKLTRFTLLSLKNLLEGGTL